MEILEAALATGAGGIDGETAFKLHDTYGFPLDLTADVCRERGVSVDEAGFQAAMERQRTQARAAGKFKMAQGLSYSGAPTAFEGYEALTVPGAKVTALYIGGASVERVSAGDDAVVVLERTPFYAESGGQVGDVGEFRNATARFLVEDTTKIQADVHGHQGRMLEGELRLGDLVEARVDSAQRARTMRNHSVTHLMHKALREVLGSHVQQKGSLVDAQRTRFDFSHGAAVTRDKLNLIEDRVNAEILANTATQARVLPLEQAQQSGAMMLFGEKYGETVRVLDIGSSRELCGGTHVARTGDIGMFRILSESGVAAGIRRIEATTGEGALAQARLEHTILESVASNMRSAPEELAARISGLLESQRQLERELAQLKSRLASAQGDELASQAVVIDGVKVLATQMPGADAKALRDALDQLKNKLHSAIIVLGSTEGAKVQLAAGVTPDLTSRLKAGELVNFVAQQVGGKGGGKPDLAMAGGPEVQALPGALASVHDWVRAKLSA
jgi:alanyl-tRNA synthetase